MNIRNSLSALLGLAALCAADVASAQPYTYVEIAWEFAEGDQLGFLDVSVRPAIAEDGTVVFTGYTPLNNVSGGPDRLFIGNGGPLTAVEVKSAGFTDVRSVAVNTAGYVALDAVRSDVAGSYRGIYRTSSVAAPLTTIYEGLVGAFDPLQPPTSFSGNVALADDGTLAFSTVTNGDGAIWRGPVDGTPSVLREGDGTFFNNRGLDVNPAGQVVIEMEYSDPTRGLSRGILVFDAPNQTREQIDTAMEKASVGFSSKVAINDAGQVAFSTNSSATLQFYDPPGDPSGTLVDTVQITPGVWRAEPTAFGQPSNLTQIADDATYTNFSSVDINADGTVVFQAAPIGGSGGIFKGNDPVADKIIQVGDVRGDELFSVVIMGELNDAGELSVITSDFNSTDRKVWKIQGILPPPPPPPPVSPWLEIIRRILRLLFALFGR